jgi:hypothetical protein
VKRRNILITLDHAHGKTFAALAEEHGVSIGRIHQIYHETLNQLGIPYRSASAVSIGLEVQRLVFMPTRYSPESFHYELKRERRNDEESAIERFYWSH